MLYRYQNVLALAALIGLVAACGSSNPPNQQIAETRMVIQQAEQIGADDYAPLELREAKRKLEVAREAVDNDDYEEAKRLLEQARVDAELAHIKTLSGKSQKAVSELRESIRILTEEIERRSNHD